MNFPEDLKYTTEHEWVRIEGDVATVGITDYAQEKLGDIVFVELPEEEETIDKGDTFGVVESTKSVSDLYVPLTGSVIETNDPLLDSPEIINEDPYGEGWMIRLKLKNLQEVKELLDAKAYQKLIEEEEGA
ncbi:MAG: glycine cleavage system protein GcvH [Deltaproteobacteria bacterium]|nr:glycine cleavage system protein GcvH [Deltaproteobacteria bacterium]